MYRVHNHASGGLLELGKFNLINYLLSAKSSPVASVAMEGD